VPSFLCNFLLAEPITVSLLAGMMIRILAISVTNEQVGKRETGIRLREGFPLHWPIYQFEKYGTPVAL
jgi:hypothetical protein